ncbi:MAG TPA: hypothetical protein VM512_14345 [Burkholderiaceae bacterium]|jgi:hypothetical protein|nr:hypothetical protein [Burkholderiaceae bacterium]
MAVKGRWQRQRIVCNLVVEKLVDLSTLLTWLGTASRDFRGRGASNGPSWLRSISNTFCWELSKPTASKRGDIALSDTGPQDHRGIDVRRPHGVRNLHGKRIRRLYTTCTSSGLHWGGPSKRVANASNEIYKPACDVRAVLMATANAANAYLATELSAAERDELLVGAPHTALADYAASLEADIASGRFAPPDMPDESRGDRHGSEDAGASTRYSTRKACVHGMRP